MKPPIIAFLAQRKLLVKNYSGNMILTGGGFLILMPCLLACLPFYILNPSQDNILYITMILALALCGLLDDVLGDSSSKGLAGHFSSLLSGKMSTGIIKAMTGVLFGLLLAFSRNRRPVDIITNVLLFSLSVNTINLFDLRPGRAIKAFGILMLTSVILAGFSGLYLILPVAVVIAFYMGGEMDEFYMLGDTGANLLGGILGYYQVMILPVPAKAVLVVLLALLHVFAEFKSISKCIDEVPLLTKIDMLGRKRER